MGSAAVEFVLLTPLVVLLTLLPVQLGLWLHGRNLVTVAAQEAAREAAAADLTAPAAEQRGRAAAESFTAGQRVVDVHAITVHRGTTTSIASVSGAGVTMIPGLRLNVAARASSGVERFVGPP